MWYTIDMKLLTRIAIITLALIAISCTSQLHAHEIYEMGEASWYGEEDHGNLTANGEIFDSYAMTAAHQTLRFGTLVRVIHVYNGKEVVVRINDRGPFAKDRIIDLSYGAALAIDMVQEGVAPVLLEIVHMPDRPESAYNRVEDAPEVHMQLGVFSTLERAQDFIRPLTNRKHNFSYEPVIEETEQGLYRISIYSIQQEDLNAFTRYVESIGYHDIFRYVPVDSVDSADSLGSLDSE